MLSRTPSSQPWKTLAWDGLTPGPWVEELHRSDAVINLSGRSVNCRYNAENRREIFDSRIKPTLLLGELIAASPTPPRIWMNASTSTFYRNAYDRPQDEFTGELGDLPSERGTREPADQPETWSFSIDVAHQWEAAFAAIPTPQTRKIRLRSSMVMSPDAGGVFSVLSRLVRLGLGGSVGSGKQYVSWIHDIDFCRITDLLLEHPELADATNGIVNMTAPNPLPNREFMQILRQGWGARIGLPATKWMVEIGTFLMRTESELVLKSRRAVPTLLLNEGYDFVYPTWSSAVTNLVRRSNPK
ncbi:epimerase [Granulicella cerasi]|uniref:Epimerase n=1 Tax=Granulicella cerasi TaxID=741063 RepID=A0ABW1ZF92_9BACT